MKKLFASVDTTAKWDTLKVSCDPSDEMYQVGGKGAQYAGTPDIKWNYVVFFQDTKKLWNRGIFYADLSSLEGRVKAVEDELAAAINFEVQTY